MQQYSPINIHDTWQDDHQRFIPMALVESSSEYLSRLFYDTAYSVWILTHEKKGESASVMVMTSLAFDVELLLKAYRQLYRSARITYKPEYDAYFKRLRNTTPKS